MAREKMTTYVDEDLLRSAKVLAANRNGKICEVFGEALKRYLEEANGDGGDGSQQPRPRVPLLSGGKDPTFGGRFEEELYRP